jgi:hypothetical protein
MIYSMNQDQRAVLIAEQLPKNKSRINTFSSMKEYVLASNKSECVLVEDNLKPQQIIQMCLERNIQHIIQNSKMNILEKLKIIDRILSDPFAFMTFHSKLFPDSSDFISFAFHSKENRTDLINRVLNFLNIDSKNHNTEHILKCTEELIMNAQVHAPRVGDFKSPHNMGFLVERIGDYVALSVFDDYGSMNMNKFLKKILNNFIIGTADAINYGSGGAGLGSSIIFESAEVLYITILPKKITRVTVLSPIKMRAKDKDVEQKSIHIINSL